MWIGYSLSLDRNGSWRGGHIAQQRVEHGAPGVALGQVLRYLDAIASGKTLYSLLAEVDPALIALAARERHQRVRPLSEAELKLLDF